MLGEAIPTAMPARLIVAVDAFAFADPEVVEALQPMVGRLRALVANAREEVMAPAGLTQWARAQRTLQPVEAWATFKDWIECHNPRLAFSVARNLLLGSMISQAECQWAGLVRQEACGRMRYLLPPGTILCMPTTPFPAPKRGEPLSIAGRQRDRLLCLCCHGGLTGVPQVSIPGAAIGGLPIGLSVVGSPGSDAMLVGVAAALRDG